RSRPVARHTPARASPVGVWRGPHCEREPSDPQLGLDLRSHLVAVGFGQPVRELRTIQVVLLGPNRFDDDTGEGTADLCGALHAELPAQSPAEARAESIADARRVFGGCIRDRADHDRLVGTRRDPDALVATGDTLATDAGAL